MAAIRVLQPNNSGYNDRFRAREPLINYSISLACRAVVDQGGFLQ